MKKSPSSPAVCGTVRGGMTRENTTIVEIRDNAYETTPVIGWGWPDEAQLADFVAQDPQAEKKDQMKLAERSLKNDSAYATLYFVS